VEGRRDPHAAPPARCGPAPAASRSFASGMAGPGVAGSARGDGPGRAPSGDAIDRHSWHDRALAPRHRPPPLGAPVTPGRSGRPATHRKVRSAVLRLARENESWGYHRIHGELAGLGITVAPSTVWQILKNAGISPAPRRDGPGWAEFLRSQAQGILALDFFTADLLNGAKVYVLAIIEHGTRRVRIRGATRHPVQSWVVQQARNLLMDIDDAGLSVDMTDPSQHRVRDRLPSHRAGRHSRREPGRAEQEPAPHRPGDIRHRHQRDPDLPLAQR
jgi:hypothetical protein